MKQPPDFAAFYRKSGAEKSNNANKNCSDSDISAPGGLFFLFLLVFSGTQAVLLFCFAALLYAGKLVCNLFHGFALELFAFTALAVCFFNVVFGWVTLFVNETHNKENNRHKRCAEKKRNKYA